MNLDKVIEEFRKTKVYQYLLVAGFQNEAEVFLCTKLEEAYDKGRLDGYFAKQLENETLDEQLSKAIKDEFSSIGKMSYDHDDEIEARKKAGEKPFDKEN